jgi:hypothetical protein
MTVHKLPAFARTVPLHLGVILPIKVPNSIRCEHVTRQCESDQSRWLPSALTRAANTSYECSTVCNNNALESCYNAQCHALLAFACDCATAETDLAHEYHMHSAGTTTQIVFMEM